MNVLKSAQPVGAASSGRLPVIGIIEGDTQADFPNVNDFDGITLVCGSEYHCIDDNTMYCMQSDGTWILQDEASRMDVYTKAQTDAAIQAAANPLHGWTNYLLNCTCKNLLDVFTADSGTTATIQGVTWTVHKDGSVTADSGGSPATGTSFFYIWPNPTNIRFDDKTFCGGCPAGGSASTYEVQIAEGSTIKHDYGDGLQNPSGYTYRYFVLCVRSGYVANNLVFKPYVYSEGVYNESAGFSAYAPTLSELYAAFLGITS